MKGRHAMSRGGSRGVFRKGQRINRMNLKPRPMRGGTRL